jgi:hypothetical protein
MPIPLSEALRASPETQRGTPAAITSAADSALLANSIRALAMDAVQAANSGHPGMPMGMAELAVALWNRHFRHNPADPHCADRGSGRNVRLVEADPARRRGGKTGDNPMSETPLRAARAINGQAYRGEQL